MSSQKSADLVTWQDAEDALTAAVEYLFALPDREHGWLNAGSRSAWPQILRNRRDGDYGVGQGENADDAPPPSPQLTRRMVALVEAMLTGPAACANAVPEGHRDLVGRVIVMQRWPGADAFGWDRVWRAQRGRLFNLARGEETRTTSDGMRKAYERAIERIARRMERSGVASMIGIHA